MYYRGAQAAIVVYDITNEVSPGTRWPTVATAAVRTKVRPGAVVKLDFVVSDMILLSLVAWRVVHPAVTHTWVAWLLNECVAAARDPFWFGRSPLCGRRTGSKSFRDKPAPTS